MITVTKRLTSRTESHRIVRERSFTPAELSQIISMLRDERATGTLSIEWNQGGVRTIRFREESRITPEFEK